MKNLLITIFWVIFISLLYIALIIYIRDFDLINNTLFVSHPLIYKFKIFKGITEGLPYSMTIYQSIPLLLIALLSSLNIVLLIKRIQLLRSKGKLKVMIGSGIFLGIATTGCAVCGIPFLAFLGLGTSLAFLPYEGNEFSILTILILSISTIIIVNLYNKASKCEVVPLKKKKKN